MTENNDNTQNTNIQDLSNEQITLDTATYNALLDALDEQERTILDLSGQGAQGTEQTDVDRLASTSTNQPAAPQYDNMTNSELVDTLTQKLTDEYLQPVIAQVERIALIGEIRELKRTEGFERWDELQKDIMEVAANNPSLSLQDAYKLVESKKPSSSKPTNEQPSKKEDRSNLLRHLPPRIPLGEKPGAAAAAATKEAGPVTRKKAAWDDIMGGSKT